MSRFDVCALGELLIDFTENGLSSQGNPIMEANPGGAPCNVLAMLRKQGYKTAFIGKIGDDIFGRQLRKTVEDIGINTEGLITDRSVNTTLAFVHTLNGGDREFSFYRNPGAGDTFCGAVLGKILEYGMRDFSDSELKDMLLFANAAAGIVTERKGALKVMPTMSEIAEMIRSSTNYRA